MEGTGTIIWIHLFCNKMLVKIYLFKEVLTEKTHQFSLLQKKSLEKEELCQRLKEQLDALEKETASKLSEMDSFNNELKVIIFYYIHF